MQIKNRIYLVLGLCLFQGLYTLGFAMTLEEKLDDNKNNTLINIAERASMMADITRGLQYPKTKLQNAKSLYFGDTFQYESTGKNHFESTHSSINNKLIANQYAEAVLENAIGAISRGMDTKTDGIPVMVYNPLFIEREDVVSVNLKFQTAPPPFIHVYNANKLEVRSQIIARHDKSLDVIFLAKMPMSGVEVFDIIPSMDSSRMPIRLKVTPQSLENYKYKIELNKNGDISRIYDKAAKQEILSKPIQLELFNDKTDTINVSENKAVETPKIPREIVKAKPEIKIIEQGAVRIAIQVRRVYAGSEYIQKIRLAAGGAGDRLEIDHQINWKTKHSLLKTSFPLSVSNTTAMYDSGLGDIYRSYIDPAHNQSSVKQWANIDRPDKSYGIAILQDYQNGWEQPNKNTLRLNLFPPANVKKAANETGSTPLGFGQHHFQTAIYGHTSTWKEGEVFWQAARLNSPMMAFITLTHEGDFGKHFYPVVFENRQVALNQMKKGNDLNEYVFRFHELAGEPANNLNLRFGLQILSAQEIDDKENPVGPATINGKTLSFDMTPNQSRSFAIRLADSLMINEPPKVNPLKLSYNQDGISTQTDKRNGDFDGKGRCLAAEMIPSVITTEDIAFQLGSWEKDQLNVLSCQGQTIGFESGKFKQIYLLAASIDTDVTAEFKVGEIAFPLTVQKYNGLLEEWYSPVIDGNRRNVSSLLPAIRKPSIIAWAGDRIYSSDGRIETNYPVYLFKYKLPIPKNANYLVLPNDTNIKILAITVADNPNDCVMPAGLDD